MIKRKICVVTGTRAEYGLLYWLMKEIEETGDLELQIIVTGMHLSPEFGLTYQQIEQNGFSINKKVEMLLSSDSEVGITKSMGLGMIGFADALIDLAPDMLVVLGDRFEIFAAAGAATVANIPIAHIHGGETTEGAFDEAFRHSITKMSHFHFTSTDEYRKRVIQLGEQPDKVFNVGAIGIDNVNKIKLFNKEEFENSIDFKLEKSNFLITFHPVTLEQTTSQEQFANLLEVLDAQTKTNLIFTKANADKDGRVINTMIDEYVKNHSDKATAFTSLGQQRYLSALKYVDAVIGNSSSGIIEAPTFKTATINIGDRQRGRIRAISVIDCQPTLLSISDAIKQLFSQSFQKQLSKVESPYGNGGVAKRIVHVLKDVNLDGVLKKQFYNIEIAA